MENEATKNNVTNNNIGYLLDLSNDYEIENSVVLGLALDSRKVKAGFIFFALIGTKQNGEDYAKAAQDNGAIAIVAQNHIEGLSIPVIVVEDAYLAMSAAAQRFCPEQPANVIAVTGTNGKSSTVDFLRQIWSSCGKNAASLGTLGAIMPDGAINLGFTTPDAIALHQTLAMIAQKGITHLAMESSSHALEQKRMHGVKLVAGGFTNLTQDHLDYHGNMDNYANAKLILFRDLLPKTAPAVINADATEAPRFEAAVQDYGLEMKLVGWRGNYLKIQELWPKPASQRVDYRFNGKTYPVEIPLIGEFQALNATMAAGIALAMGDEPDGVFKALSQLRPVKGRMEHVGATKNSAHIFVDYAHTPDGLDVLLRAIRPHAPGKIILVFGCGGDRDKAKRPIMGAIGAKFADVVIVTDDNPRSESPPIIRGEIIAAVPNAIEIGDRAEAILSAISMSQSGDAVIIAGKGHETGQIIGDKVLPFSDQDTIIEYLQNNGGTIV